MRLTILGLPGSGKSTLARAIAEQKKIPYIHIDQFWLEAGGGHNSKSTPDPERAHAHVREKVLEAIQEEAWVSDGVYSKVQPDIAKRADTLIFLDMPLWRRLLNHAERTFMRSNAHQGMTFLNDLSFFREMIGRDSVRDAKLKKILEEYREKVLVLRSRKEINQYLRDLM